MGEMSTESKREKCSESEKRGQIKREEEMTAARAEEGGREGKTRWREAGRRSLICRGVNCLDPQ